MNDKLKEYYIQNMDKEVDEKELFMYSLLINKPIVYETKATWFTKSNEPLVLGLYFLEKNNKSFFTQEEWWNIIQKTELKNIGNNILWFISKTANISFTKDQWEYILENVNLNEKDSLNNNVLMTFINLNKISIINDHWDIFFKKSNINTKPKNSYTILYHLCWYAEKIDKKIFEDIKMLNQPKMINDTVRSFYDNAYKYNRSNKALVMKNFSFFVKIFHDQIQEKSIHFLKQKKATEFLTMIENIQQYHSLKKELKNNTIKKTQLKI